MRLLKLLAIISVLNFCSCNQSATEEYVINWDETRRYYLEHLKRSKEGLRQLQSKDPKDKGNKTLFAEVRNNFKVAEPYASYLNPEVGHRVNGPALPVFREDNGKVLAPIGLQKIEESIYEGGVEKDEFQKEIEYTIGLLDVLQNNIEKRELTSQRFFIAVQQQLMRVISFSMSNFDTPVSAQGINDAALTLKSLKSVYEKTLQYDMQKEKPKLDEEFIKNLNSAIQLATNYSGKNEDFDRYNYIRNYLNHICRNWKEIRDASGYWEDSKDYPFNFEAPTFFEPDSFNLSYFTPSVNKNPTREQVELGEKLFFDPNLSEGGNVSCASCHIPAKTYQDGLSTAMDNNQQPLERNTPTLINVAYQQNFFWDGRSQDLLSQINQVFTNEREFNSEVHNFSDRILQDSSYKKMFKQTFGRKPGSNRELVKAISSYISTLKGFNSKFDKNIRGEENTLTAEEKHGFNLFMGKALCATCHFMPLTNGTVPPFFSETEREVIGVPETAENLKLDDDAGFYWMYGADIHKGMFKTPTVRNSALTAPYMHNGVYTTLEEVIDFYNSGGGAGLGFDLPHQTLPFDELSLTEGEEKALVAYLKTLTDAEVSNVKEEEDIL
ncbi:cytochrome-c peroxidase [Autumnicola musiva]|uniref:Cytochrome c peroxidase n=1 Tax=Autumnicola musiva TaxID=3075589 RepID=A0ABU3D784_9FLAO|nr:cytochrome c peroxidase [Zunongwangia sp. F117]MDT0677399.1 cytochrome c peroxidase [Zunongwangia sp. F117]